MATPDVASALEGIEIEHIEASVSNEAIFTDVDNDDSSLQTVDSLIRRRAAQNPSSHIVSYPSTDIQFVDYTMQQLDVFAWRVAKHYEKDIPVRVSSSEKPRVVALLGPSNFEYLVTILALTKLGHTALLLSTRIPQPAIESLLSSTGSSVLLSDARHQDMAEKVRDSMGTDIFNIVGRSTFEFPIEAHSDTQLDSHLDPAIETNNIAFIIHSSGSTGLPKAIYQTHKSCLANYAISMDMKAFITLPLFHNHGICNMFRAVYSSKSIHLYNADLPLTQGYLVRIMREHEFEIFYGVPYALKLLYETEEGIQLLQKLKVVMYGGSACPDELGNSLVDNNVNLIGHYGATEVGQLMTSFRPEGDKAWNYVREHDRLSPYLNWVPRGPGLFECVVTKGWPAKVQSNQPDGSYATKDLFQPHPTIPGAWKYIARLDDTLVLVNGEKFGPVAMEGQIRSNRDVAEVVVFGAGRPCLGALIVPAPSLSGKPQEEILDVIWPVVKSANQSVDSFAHISKSMIKLLPTDCAYPRTDKGSIIRQAFYKTFQKEIEEAYDEKDAETANRQKLNLAEMRVFVRNLLSDSLPAAGQVEDTTDFFLLGLDSLQAIQMRSSILRNVDLGEGRKLGQNIAFDYPSIEKLSSFLYSLSIGQAADQKSSVESEMQDLINKYKTLGAAQASTVVLTGATGSLGAHVAVKLAPNPKIRKIVCLARAPNSSSAQKRVVESLIQRRLLHTLSQEERHKIVALSSDLTDSRLGLSEDVYTSISKDLIAVIHCAWSVNFNMQLSSFEKSNIVGVRHLLDLCHTSPAKPSMNFCSSISTCVRSTVIPVPEAVPDLGWAQGMGYAQSKSVAEHICANAAGQGVKVRVLRVGQLVGDTQHGVWNAQEAVPMMLQTALTVGSLPKLQETPSWLPVDTAAESITDISLSDAGSLFANVTHPKTFDFVKDLLPALKEAGLEFEQVEPKEWVRRLRASNPDPKLNPPIKLVDFFASKYDKDEFAPSKLFATDVAQSLSPSLANAPVLDQGFVKKFTEYFLQNAWTALPESTTYPKFAVFVSGIDEATSTAIGRNVSYWLSVPLVEGQSLHTRPAIEKLRQGVAISLEDTTGWLSRLSSRITEVLLELSHPSVVLTSSTMSQSWRFQLRDSLARQNIKTLFIDLQATSDPNQQISILGERERPAVGEIDVLPVDLDGDESEVFENVKWMLQVKGLNPSE
ncbi:unnamed protein product [Clonostachys byssicola]|uniref:Carrier domain-containing protein n=1 Tax=Clonostachys byssicola TaxID=160290 RepID=A0A9N9UV82_9HYPO|nr:unnamed protein product [Clonostachys byssicola]